MMHGASIFSIRPPMLIRLTSEIKDRRRNMLIHQPHAAKTNQLRRIGTRRLVALGYGVRSCPGCPRLELDGEEIGGAMKLSRACIKIIRVLHRTSWARGSFVMLYQLPADSVASLRKNTLPLRPCVLDNHICHMKWLGKQQT